MKRYIYSIALLMASMGSVITSCDGYLDITPKGKALLENVDQYANIMNTMTMSTYPLCGINYIVDDVWFSPSVVLDKGASIAGDHFCWVNPSASVNRLNLYTNSSVNLYSNCYARICKISNIILDFIGSAKGDDNLRKQTIAEARALRAYNYFMLANVFGKHYNAETAATDICVPLYEHYDLESRPRQGTVAQVYQLIEDDINAAIPDLSNTPQNCLHFSKAAGYLLKAKVHLFKQEFDKAKEAALESHKLNNYVFDFKTIASLTALQKFDTNPENLFMAGYAGISNATVMNNLYGMSPELAGLFGATFDTEADVKDTRYKYFFSFTNKSNVTGNANGTTELDRKDARFAPGWHETLKGSQFYCYNSAGLRTTDAILILAECHARKGEYSEMKTYLDKVRTKRIIDYTTATENPASTTEAVNIVINERRKEFIYGFNRWFDLRRLNAEPAFRKTLSRTAPANPDPACGFEQRTYTLQPDSYLWIIPLPQDEFTLYGPSLKYNVPY